MRERHRTREWRGQPQNSVRIDEKEKKNEEAEWKPDACYDIFKEKVLFLETLLAIP